MKLAERIVSCSLIWLLILTPSASAWDGVGHMAVAYVAYQHLSPATKTRVNKLLRLNPDYHKWLATIPQGTPAAKRNMMIFMIAATWPDQIRSKPGYTDDGTQGGNRPDGATSVQNIGYPDHLHHKYWHFVDTPFSTDGTPLPAIPTPNAGTQIATFRSVLASTESDRLKSYDLVWLLHLVGDVHQPLHAATRVSSTDPQGDNGGNKVMLCTAPCKNELHAFWDDLLGTGSSPATAIMVGQSLPDANSTLAAKKDAADWIKESFDAAQSDVYVTPVGAGDGPFTLTTAYRNAAKDTAKQRVALAGVRLANLLNDEFG